jgi:DMATS type aromatic prenyltransferase
VTTVDLAAGTLFESGAAQLRTLCRAAGFAPDEPAILDLFGDLAATWGDTPLAATPRWSGIGDDCSPLEFSIVLGGRAPELRVLVEAHADPPSPHAYWHAGQALTARLRARFGLRTEALEAVEDLFGPRETGAPIYFATFHAAVLRPGAAPRFKLYLNPAAQGRPPERVCQEALERLGLGRAWPRIAAVLQPNVQVMFFALDLSDGVEPRVKVYLRYRGATVDELERAAGVAEDYAAGDARALCRAITGSPTPRLARAVLVALHLRRDDPARIARSALQVPVYPHATSDAVACRRVRALLRAHDLPVTTYEACLDALSARPRAEEVGIHSWLSFQREGGAPRITVYFSPRLYLARYGPLSLEPPRCWPSPVLAPDPRWA